MTIILGTEELISESPLASCPFKHPANLAWILLPNNFILIGLGNSNQSNRVICCILKLDYLAQSELLDIVGDLTNKARLTISRKATPEI